MKILRISLRNIASLEGSHTVDFTRDPLRAAGLFGISGPTGSGKSTLLDALCLALYDDTPRLRRVGRLAEFASGERQNDPRNLLRLGAGEGSAEVAFVGVDGAAYTARWSVRRSRGRPDGTLQSAEITLFRGDVPAGVNGVIEQGGRKTEVLPVIETKVGLSFEQFTRAVLLAQNDFAAFLKAGDKDRAEILQALTGTGRFESLSIAVFTRCSIEQRAVADMAARLTGNPPLAPEARAAAESASASAESAWMDAVGSVRIREAHAEWFRRFAELTRQAGAAAVLLGEKITLRDNAKPRRIELNHTEEAAREARPLRDAERRLSSECAEAEKAWRAATTAEETARTGFEERRLRQEAADLAVATAKAALDHAKPQLLQARELDAKLAPLAERLAAAVRDREEIEACVRQLTAARDARCNQLGAAQTERASLLEKRTALEPFAAFAPEAAAWRHRLDHADACRKSLEDAEAKLALRVKEEKARMNAAQAERAGEAAARAAAKKAGEALKLAEACMRGYDGEKIARSRSEADAARTALRDLENHLHERNTASGQAGAVESAIAALESAIETDSRSLAELQEKRIPNAELILEATRRAFELAQAAVTDEAVRLREKLAPGQPCPVCGATDHPHAGQPPADDAAALRALRADCAVKERELRAFQDAAAGLATARLGRIEQHAAKQKTWVELRTRLTLLEAARHEHPAALSILTLPSDERAAALASQLAAQHNLLAAAESADSARRAAEKLRDERRAQRDNSAAALDEIDKRLARLEAELTGLGAAREAAAVRQAEAGKVFCTSVDDLTLLFAGLPESRAAWDRDAAAFRNSFFESTTTFLALEKRLAELGATIRETEAALNFSNEALSRAQSELAAKRSVELTAGNAHETVRALRSAIFGGRAADAVERELSDALTGADEDRRRKAGELEATGHQLTAAAETSKAVRQAHAGAIARQSAATAALDAWLEAFATRTGRAFDRTALESVLVRDDAWIRAERADLDALEGAVRTAEGALAVHQSALEAHVAARPTPEEEPTVAADLAALRLALEAAAQRRDAARTCLHADDMRLRDNAQLAAQLHERRAAAEPWLKLNELIGSADGAKFRGIAQRRTLDILLGYANAQLELLAARYRLERLRESLNLIVIDRDMADERRSVHSLSGGESFLVSLALALGLASLTSNRLRIESLFIDEGFGSLDPETLNTAMNALMQLEAQGRKVGVISHVTEMTDAIPVQIRVVKGRSGASRLIVPGAPDVGSRPGDELIQDPQKAQAAEAAGRIAARILSILRREHAEGRDKVSSRALREEIGCTPAEFSAASEALGTGVRREGKSLGLVKGPETEA